MLAYEEGSPTSWVHIHAPALLMNCHGDAIFPLSTSHDSPGKVSTSLPSPGFFFSDLNMHLVGPGASYGQHVLWLRSRGSFCYLCSPGPSLLLLNEACPLLVILGSSWGLFISCSGAPVGWWSFSYLCSNSLRAETLFLHSECSLARWWLIDWMQRTLPLDGLES
jgi:hypothetical protein